MKNKVKLFGIIAIAVVIGLSMISCGQTGGTIEIVNKTGVSIWAAALSEADGNRLLNDEMGLDELFSIVTILADGKTGVWNFEEDGKYYWMWFDDEDENSDAGIVTLEGGDKKTFEAKF